MTGEACVTELRRNRASQICHTFVERTQPGLYIKHFVRKTRRRHLKSCFSRARAHPLNSQRNENSFSRTRDLPRSRYLPGSGRPGYWTRSGPGRSAARHAFARCGCTGQHDWPAMTEHNRLTTAPVIIIRLNAGSIFFPDDDL